MDSQEQSTIRTAAYLAAQQRNDLRGFAATGTGKTNRRNVQCLPPNVKCGGRCIPPNWDCRLKGQGTNSELRVHSFDPLKGAASVQRGLTEVRRGVLQGNPARVQRGRGAIERGVVKLVPGNNLEQKKQLRQNLEKHGAAIGAVLGVASLGYAFRKGINNPTFLRTTFGRNVKTAIDDGVERVLGAVPILGPRRQAVQAAASGFRDQNAFQIARSTNWGPTSQVERLRDLNPAGLADTPLTSTHRNAHSALSSALNTVNNSPSNNHAEWAARHRAAFWNANVGRNKENVFAEASAQSFLQRQFSFSTADAKDTSSIKRALTNYFTEEKQSLTALAKQQGFGIGKKALTDDEITDFTTRLARAGGYGTQMTEDVQKHLSAVMKSTPKGTTDRLYSATVNGCDSYYKELGSIFSNSAGAPTITKEQRAAGLSELIKTADTVRGRYLSNQLGLGARIAGEGHSELISSAFYATRVVGTRGSTYSVTDRLATQAATELTGRRIGPAEAFEVLRTEFGFTGIRRARGSSAGRNRGRR
jgi:hypothetical protein